MLYLGIDQHRKQLTVCVRNEKGDVIFRRQVSTEWERVRAFPFGRGPRLQGQSEVARGLRHASGASE